MHHVGAFAELETQMCNWVPGETSPDRMDALVWGFTDLFIAEDEPQSGVVVYDEPVNISAF
jgi:phage terminase large subunit-like protein